jgi:tetraacyldisaccharide 4'-kinase
MKTPFFWYQPQGFFSTLLGPLGWFYGKGGKLISAFKKPKRLQIPIISIGNIVCGGAGKTPTAIALMHLLTERGYKVHFVTRGHGGKERGPLAVDLSYHKAWDVGDEPLLLAQHAPTWVAKKRFEGVKKAIENGAQLIILDDGHQTNLYKDVSLVVIDLLQGFGNECVIPAGPLRENLFEGLKRADGFIGVAPASVIPVLAKAGNTGIQETSHIKTPGSRILKKAKQALSFSKFRNDAILLMEKVTQASKESTPLFKAQTVTQPLKISSNQVVAFCGLGFPQKFYMSLENAGFDLMATESFPDHYLYKNEDLLRLSKLAQKLNSVLITTRKDLVKIPTSWQAQLHVLDITLEFEDPIGICDFILQKIHPLKESIL